MINIVKRLLFKKRDKKIEEFKRLLQSQELRATLSQNNLEKELKENTNLKIKLIEVHGSYSTLKDIESSLNKELNLCKKEGQKLEKDNKGLVKINEGLKKELRPQYKTLKKAHKKEVDNLNKSINDYNEMNKNLEGLVSRLMEDKAQAKQDRSLLNDYKKDLNRALKVETHYHDMVEENRIFKKKLKDLEE